MTRFTRFAIGVLMCALLVVPLSADDPPKKLTPDDRKKLEAKWEERNASGLKSYQAGNIG